MRYLLLYINKEPTLKACTEVKISLTYSLLPKIRHLNIFIFSPEAVDEGTVACKMKTKMQRDISPPWGGICLGFFRCSHCRLVGWTTTELLHAQSIQIMHKGWRCSLTNTSPWLLFKDWRYGWPWLGCAAFHSSVVWWGLLYLYSAPDVTEMSLVETMLPLCFISVVFYEAECRQGRKAVVQIISQVTLLCHWGDFGPYQRANTALHLQNISLKVSSWAPHSFWNYPARDVQPRNKYNFSECLVFTLAKSVDAVFQKPQGNWIIPSPTAQCPFI